MIPTYISEKLTPAELLEAEHFEQDMLESNFRIFVAGMRSSNPALKFIAMDTPYKYTVVQLPDVSELELLQLLNFDVQNPDMVRREFANANGDAIDTWDQNFDVFMAALGNPNLSTATAKSLLKSLYSRRQESFEYRDFLELVDDQLRDKWSPESFSVSVLLALVELFEEQQMPEPLKYYGKLYRKSMRLSGKSSE